MSPTTFFDTPSRPVTSRSRRPLSGPDEAALERALLVYQALGWPVRVHPGARRVSVGTAGG